MARSPVRRGLDRTRHPSLAVASGVALAIVSYAAWRGLSDLVAGAPLAARDLGWSTTADLERLSGLIGHEPVLIAIVAALLTTLSLSLRAFLHRDTAIPRRILSLPIVVVLASAVATLVYGACWSFVHRVDARPASARDIGNDAVAAADLMTTRLTAIRSHLDQAVNWSARQTAREEGEASIICGVGSARDRGALVRARASVGDGLVALRDAGDGWLTPLQAEADTLRRMGDASRQQGAAADAAAARHAGEVRGRALQGLRRLAVLGQPFAIRLRALAEPLVVPPGQSGFVCHDPTLAGHLRKAAQAAAAPARLRLRTAVFDGGPAGVANAIHDLWMEGGAHLEGLFAYAAWGRALAGEIVPVSHTTAGAPIDTRDMLALLMSLGLTLGSLALAVGMLKPSPGRRAPETRPITLAPPSRKPDRVVARHVVTALRSAVEGMPAGSDLDWIRRHFLHHGGATYFAIPDLAAMPRDVAPCVDMRRALALNQLAGVLVDLGQVSPPGRGPAIDPANNAAASGSGCEAQVRIKAALALEVAGWPPRPHGDIELFRVIAPIEGAPLLCLIDDAVRSGRGLTQTPPAVDKTSAEAPLLRLEYQASTA